MKKSSLYLLILFGFIFLFRIYLSFSVTQFSDDTSYLHMRNIDSIKENLKPIIYDDLSYGGRPVILNWIFYYFLLCFSFIPFYLKIIPQLWISLLVIIVYLLAKEITGDEKSALFASLISGFTPLLIKETINKISVYSLVLPLFFYLMYCFLKINNRNYLYTFLFLFLFFAFLHPLSILFSLSLMLYLIFKYTEERPITKNEIRLTILTFVISLSINFLYYYRAIIQYGLEIFGRNIPKSLLTNTFNEVNIFSLILGLGYISVIFGIIGLYYGYKKLKSDSIFLLGSFLLFIFLILLLGLLDFYTALMFIGILTAIASSLALYRFDKYMDLTKVHKYKIYFFISLIIVFVLLYFIPSINVSAAQIRNSMNDKEIESLNWIKLDSSIDDVVFGSIYEGHVISYYSDRKNFIDTNFLMAPSPVSRVLDSDALISMQSSDMALRLYKKHNIKYIFFSNKFRRLTGMNELNYDDMYCFEKHDYVYKIIC